jgi:hypothetical protein
MSLTTTQQLDIDPLNNITKQNKKTPAKQKIQPKHQTPQKTRGKKITTTRRESKEIACSFRQIFRICFTQELLGYLSSLHNKTKTCLNIFMCRLSTKITKSIVENAVALLELPISGLLSMCGFPRSRHVCMLK